MHKFQPSPRTLERKLSWLHGKADMHALHGESESAPVAAFRRKCCEWLALPENTDEGGISIAAARTAYHVCLRFDTAQKYLEHEDSSIRRSARKAIKGIRHDNFAQIKKKLQRLDSQAHKIAMRRAHRRNETAEQERKDRELCIDIGNGFELHRLHSIASIQGIGCTLENCAAIGRDARNYAKLIERGQIELWALRRQSHPVCLVELESGSRRVIQIAGKNNSTPKMPRSAIFRIQSELRIEDEDEKLFVKAGVFKAFQNGEPPVDPVTIGTTTYWLWILQQGNEIIIAAREQSRKKRRWSRFTRTNGIDRNLIGNQLWDMPAIHLSEHDECPEFAGNEWNQLSEDELINLARSHPHFAAVLPLVSGTTG